jgi:selenocysteine lyase/cysteine desulfurase
MPLRLAKPNANPIMLTPESRNLHFPGLAAMTYLNTAAESVPPSCVGEAIRRYWEDKLCGMDGRESHFAHVEACREIAAKTVGLDSDEVSFCSCSSEAYNLLASALDMASEDEVVVSDLEFPAGATPWLRAARPPHVRLWRATPAGELLTDDLEPLLNVKTKLVQISLVSFYNGFRVQWAALRDAVRRLAPAAVLAVDVTQALGRIRLDCEGADILISSTHKWTLGIHGGCVVGIPRASASRLTTRAGGWLHLTNAFGPDRFQTANTKVGAASFSVGMPNFVALYALNAALRYLDEVGIEAIARHADPLVASVASGLNELGVQLMTPYRPDRPAGIIAFRHSQSAQLEQALRQENIHVMHHAGRIRIAVHGYNTSADIENLLSVLAISLAKGVAL